LQEKITIIFKNDIPDNIIVKNVMNYLGFIIEENGILGNINIELRIIKPTK